MQHITVLLKEAVDGLQLTPTDTVVDATFGSGGHARAILAQLDHEGTYIGIDADATALKDQTFGDATATIHLVNDNFKHITDVVRSLHIKKVDAILADLGWRMEQFSDGGKGFSFKDDEPLSMTYGDPTDYEFTAYDIVNYWEEASIADIILALDSIEASQQHIEASQQQLHQACSPRSAALLGRSGHL